MDLALDNPWKFDTIKQSNQTKLNKNNGEFALKKTMKLIQILMRK